MSGVSAGVVGQMREGAPANTGMNAERLGRTSQRMPEIVDGGKTAGVVTLVARHGQLAQVAGRGDDEVSGVSIW